MNTKEVTPRVSVLLPVRNSGKFLKDALNSITAQSFKDFEVIVMDGESTDGSLRILNEYSKKYPNIKVFSEPDESHYHAIHKALDRAVGDFVFILSASDGYVDRDWFKKCVDAFENDSTISLVWGIPMYTTEDGRIIGPAYTYSHFLKRSGVGVNPSRSRMGTLKWIIKKFKLGELVSTAKKINTRNLRTMARILLGATNIPQKQEWFHYWLRTGQIFPDGNMCVAEKPLRRCLKLYRPGVNEPGSWMSFFFNFNANGYLSYGIPTPANFARLHRGQNTEVVKDFDEEDRVKYFSKLKKFRREYIRSQNAFAFVDRDGNAIVKIK